jgi:hypothetical protein
MRRFDGLEIFTVNLTNSGALDLRYAAQTGNNTNINLNSGLIITGESAIFNDSGFFNNGISVSGQFVLNGIPFSTFNGVLFNNGAGYKP